jgi:hypothetical protein
MMAESMWSGRAVPSPCRCPTRRTLAVPEARVAAPSTPRAQSLMFLWTLRFTSFAALYSFGSILSLLSTMFLVGPCKQARSMMESGRWVASLAYAAAIAATLAVAFTVHGVGGGVLVIILIVVQFLAFVWYCATYIPGVNELARGAGARAAASFRRGAFSFAASAGPAPL